MTTAWSPLPNARYIDRVLASLKSNPEKWRMTEATARSANLTSTWEAAWGAAYDATRETAAKHVVWEAARLAIWETAAWAVGRTVARGTAWGAILTLIAYDDCAYMLDSDVGELKIIAAFGDPRAILLLPACMVFNELKMIDGYNI